MDEKNLQIQIQDLQNQVRTLTQKVNELTAVKPSSFFNIEKSPEELDNLRRILDYKLNDITFYDESTGGGGTVTGTTAAVKFVRRDDQTKWFKFQKRAGMNYDADNVFELYANTPDASRFNACFNGRSGMGTNANIGSYIITVNHETAKVKTALNGQFQVELYRNGSLTGAGIVIGDARLILNNDTKSGIISYLNGVGTDGMSGLCYAGGPLIYANYSGLNLGASLIPDSNASYDIGSSSSKINNLYSAGLVNAGQFKLNALNTAPASSSATGTLGEIRIDNSYIYVAVGTNQWKRAALSTW